MRGKKRIFGFAALLSVLLAVPLVVGLGIVDVPKFSFGGSSSTVESASTASVFVDPVKNVTDYLDAEHNVTIGSNVTFHINIANITDLFVWQINMSWDPAMLNVSRIISGDFLATSVNQTSSEALGWMMNSTDNALGYSVFVESILANVSGISGNGTLASIEFSILDYGWTDLNISLIGTLPTTLLDSEGDPIFPNVLNGYFSNKIFGDVNGDGIVDVLDFSLLGGAYRTELGDPGWKEGCDFNRDGIVDVLDFSLAGGNYRKKVPWYGG